MDFGGRLIIALEKDASNCGSDYNWTSVNDFSNPGDDDVVMSLKCVFGCVGDRVWSEWGLGFLALAALPPSSFNQI